MSDKHPITIDCHPDTSDDYPDVQVTCGEFAYYLTQAGEREFRVQQTCHNGNGWMANGKFRSYGKAFAAIIKDVKALQANYDAVAESVA